MMLKNILKFLLVFSAFFINTSIVFASQTSSLKNNANSFSCNWQACPNDAEGKIYLRLVSNDEKIGFGFALPVDEFEIPEKWIVDPVFPSSIGNAPLGCPMNPIHTKNLGLVGVGGFHAGAGGASFLRKLADERFDSNCNDHTSRRRLNEGLEVCFVSPSQGSVPEEALPLYARADREKYTTPLGRVFAFRCFGSITKVPPRQRCDVSYEMEKGIGFSYYFSESQVPLNQLISHDKTRRKTAMELRYPALDFTSKR
ncbi:hypothetical protein IWQ52_005271 [Labrenzia sp. EL_159]|nr:hypothetical protein [Labrenzia sp. EL_162]MBG6197721.1 hypothetical protein [Labrenzia sp. EL_159]